MKNFKYNAYLIAGIALIGLSGSATAGVIGSGSIANCSGGGVLVDATHITWSPTGTVAGTGCFNTGAGTNITSASNPAVLSGATGNIKNLVAGGGAVDQFMTIILNPVTNLDFVLNGFVAPVTTNGTACNTIVADNQSCIAAVGSPFLLTKNGANTTVTLTPFGTITDTDLVVSNWADFFTTQIAGTPFSIQSTIGGGGSIQSTYSAILQVSPVPEPATASLMLFGAAAMIGLARRFRKS